MLIENDFTADATPDEACDPRLWVGPVAPRLQDSAGAWSSADPSNRIGLGGKWAAVRGGGQVSSR